MITASKAKVAPGRLLIDGQWVDGSKTFETINPATGEVLTQVAEASAADVDRAVEAARRAFDGKGGSWRKMPASERGRLIWRLADLVEKHTDELAELETLDNGKPIFESRNVDMPMVVDVLRYYAGWATKIHGETVNTFDSAFTYTLREPTIPYTPVFGSESETLRLNNAAFFGRKLLKVLRLRVNRPKSIEPGTTFGKPIFQCSNFWK